MTSHLGQRTYGRLRELVLGVVAATLVATAPAAVAQTVHPTLGRWGGSGAGGTVSFVVSRDHRSLAVHDVVAGCSGAFGGDPDVYSSYPEVSDYGIYPAASVEADGRLHSLASIADYHTAGPVIAGRLGDAEGTVSITSALATDPIGAALEAYCPNGAFRDVHVAPIHARGLRDGVYKVIEPFYGAGYDDGVFDVDGEGALIEWIAGFDTPVGGDEDDPALCAETEADATSNDYQTGEPDSPVLFNSTGVFTAHTINQDPPDVYATSFVVTFASSQAATGSYVATDDFENDVLCAGAGAFTLTLSTSAELEPVKPTPEPVPRPTPTPPTPIPPGPTPPNREDACAMRFQIQQGKNTPYREPVVSPHPITVTQAVKGLDSLQSQVDRSMHKASEKAFTNTRKWVLARPNQGGVGGTGNVKRSHFEYEKKNWRLDTENLRCQNLTS